MCWAIVLSGRNVLDLLVKVGHGRWAVFSYFFCFLVRSPLILSCISLVSTEVRLVAEFGGDWVVDVLH